jgi:hypothetical protein
MGLKGKRSIELSISISICPRVNRYTLNVEIVKFVKIWKFLKPLNQDNTMGQVILQIGETAKNQLDRGGGALTKSDLVAI